LAGYELDIWQTSSAPPAATSTVTKTRTLSETVTETARLACLHGGLFFDYGLAFHMILSTFGTFFGDFLFAASRHLLFLPQRQGFDSQYTDFQEVREITERGRFRQRKNEESHYWMLRQLSMTCYVHACEQLV